MTEIKKKTQKQRHKDVDLRIWKSIWENIIGIDIDHASSEVTSWSANLVKMHLIANVELRNFRKIYG